MKKRVWDIFVHPEAETDWRNSCAICRQHTDAFCMDCEAQSVNVHPMGALSVEQLRASFDRWAVDHVTLTNALTSLVRRKYVVYKEAEQLYQYNP